MSKARPPLEPITSLVRGAGRRANVVLGKLGYSIRRASAAIDPASMAGGLKRAADRGLRVGTIIDVGASDGRWCDEALAYFPGTRSFLIEANEQHEPGLRAFKARVPGSDYVVAAAGREVGHLYFETSDDLFGGAAKPAGDAGTKLVPATTIDHEVATRSLPGPYLIKLDTHGFEVPILEGATKTLSAACLLIIEVYNFTLMPGALRFQEMIARLDAAGFRPIDLVEPMYRPKDGAFWQCDMFFARADRPEFASNSYE
jgi:FkbM family methyltransferase